MKKPPAKVKGGGKAPKGGKRGTGPGKARGIKVTGSLGTPHHRVTRKPAAGGAKKTGKPAGHHHPHHPHHVRHAPAKKAAPKKRQWSPGLDVACCAAEAFGALVIASGRPWSAEQTLALYQRTASDPHSGASIEATLLAAWGDSLGVTYNEVALEVISGALIYNTCCILGLTLPEPHAVAVAPDGTWWSWGEPFDPAAWPDLEVDEAWAVLL